MGVSVGTRWETGKGLPRDVLRLYEWQEHTRDKGVERRSWDLEGVAGDRTMRA